MPGLKAGPTYIMQITSKAAALASAAALVIGALVTVTAQIPLPGQLPGVEPLHESGQDVTPAFEGWFKNPDGSFDILFGYQPQLEGRDRHPHWAQ